MNSFEVDDASTSHDLLMERLDALTEKTLADIKAFSARENIPYDQVRRHIAERHSQYLFSNSAPTPTRQQNIRDILLSASQVLESLQTTAGVQSFVLAVNPYDVGDEGFLGGSPLGREFWRSLRGGGTAGAKALKSLAVSTLQNTSSPSTVALHGTGVPSLQKETAHSLKSEVYARVRTLLRTTSGVRNAEMKWTNHSNLSVYGVRLEGWPTSIPMQNPSTLSTGQNRELRDALLCGTLKFCRINPEASTSDGGNTSCGPIGSSSDLSWAISEEFNIPVPHVTDTGIFTYRPEPADYFPGVTDTAPLKLIPRAQERKYPAASDVEDGPALMGGGDMPLLDGGQSSSKRQRLDGG